MKTVISWLLVGGTFLWLGGCARETRPNVYLITLDTTRADHLGCYGHQAIETPHIDRLASTSTLYENAFSPAPITLPAHTSILTGTFPVHHGVRENGGFYVDEKALTLAEILREEGYDTAAFVGAFPLDSQTGIDQGFDLYDDNYPSSLDSGTHPQLRRFFDERPAAEVSRAALGWLGKRKKRNPKPFFLWTHYFDAHQPLRPPSPFRERYPNAPYDAEIASVDEAIGQVLRRLEEDGLLDETLVILTADHGEGLGEHGEATHALLLYSSTLHVPLILRDPSNLKSTTIAAPVSTVDIFPTVLDRLGLEIPQETQGISLPRSEAEAPAERAIYSETLLGRMIYGWSPLERLTVGSKFVVRAPNRRLLYDRSSDETEEVDLSSERSSEVDEFERLLLRQKAKLSQGGQQFSRGSSSPEANERLAALGYVGAVSSAALDSDDVDPERPDPHTMMKVFTLHNEGSSLNEAGRFDLATAVLNRADRLDQRNPAVLLALAQSHLGRGDLEQGHQVLERLLSVEPESVRTLFLLGRYHQNRGELSMAADLMQAAVAIDPSDLSTHLLLAHLLEDAGRPNEAEAAYRDILEQDGEHTQSTNGLATLVYRRGDTQEAIDLLESLLERQPFYAPAWLNLGVIELYQGNPDRALELARRAQLLRPGYSQAEELERRSLVKTSR